MVDILKQDERRSLMSRIRGKDSKPELLVRRWLHARGIRYRLHDASLPGRPDLVLRRYNAVILVHGCFWHRHPGCLLAYEPKTNVSFWTEKFRRNIERDSRVCRELQEAGWRILVIWECGLRERKALAGRLDAVLEWLYSGTAYKEIGR